MAARRGRFGTPEWPVDRPVPQVSVEFELRDGATVADGAAAGFPLLHGARAEPWGQTVARLHTPEGVIVGLSYAPSLH